MKLSDAQIDRLWEMADQLSFELSGTAEEYPQDEVLQDLDKKAEHIYNKLDEERCKRMKEKNGK